jgi:hypothetical protein
MTVATKDKKKGAKMPETKPLFAKQEALEDAAKFLKEACYTVEFETSWFATQRKATKAETESMLKKADDEAETDMIGISLKMLPADDPYIKKMNQAKTALYAYRDSVTIPSAQLPLISAAEKAVEEYKTVEKDVWVSKKAEAELKLERILKKKAGERIIMSGDVDKFDDYCTNVLIPNLLKAVEEANDNIDKIKANAEKKLKKRFREDLFPDEFKVGVRGPDYGEVGVSVSFEEACPRAAGRLKKSAEQRFMDTVELAVADFANSFMATAEVAAEQLSAKTKLMPPVKSEYRRLKDGVLKEQKFHKDDPTIPEGSRVIVVEYFENKKKVEEEIGPLTEDEFKALNPYESETMGKVYESTFQKLCDDLTRFEKIGKMLGDAGKPLEGIVTDVRKLFENAGSASNAKKITDEVKNSTFFRNTAASTLAKAADAMEGVVDSMPIVKKKRRRAIGKLKA